MQEAVTLAQRQAEVAEKHRRLRAFMHEQGLDAILLTRHRNFCWLTAGNENPLIFGDAEIDCFVIVVSDDRLSIVSSNVEATRVRAELDVEALGFDLIEHPYYDDTAKERIVLELAGKGRIASDHPFAGAELLDWRLDALRYVLTPAEQARYRIMGRECAQALEETCRQLQPGQTEREIAGALAAGLLARGLWPGWILVGSDERIARFRHPVATSRPVERHVMIVLGAVRGGLNMAMTRTVYLGRPPEELLARHRATTSVEAAYIAANCHVGKPYVEVLQAGIDAYKAAGFPDEWMLHWQGGPIGYGPREFKPIPGGQADPYAEQVVMLGQAAAWNPTITGAKSEDTFVVQQDGPEFLSMTSDWPTIEHVVDGLLIPRPGILVR